MSDHDDRSVSLPPSEGPSDVLTDIEGVVKWFDPRKGFGFIVGPQGQDIFVHFTIIDGDGFRVLKDGSKVTYSAEKTDKGWKATRVVRGPESLEVTVVPRRNYARTPRR
jgi:CspA family cold shock protein